MTIRLGRQSSLPRMAPLAFLLLCGAVVAQPRGDSPNPENDSDTASDQIDSGTEANDGLLRVDVDLPKIEFNVSRGPGPSLPERVIVRGQAPPSAYRRRVDQAVQATWDAFNDANSDDQFDVHCDYEAHTGTRIPQYVCRPKFLDDAEHRAGAGFQLLDKNAGLGIQQIEAARSFYMQQRLEGELNGLAASDPALQEQLKNLDDQLEKYEEARHSQE